MKLFSSAVLFSIFLTAGVAGTHATPVYVQLDWLRNAQFAGVLVAQEKGYYQKASLEVEIAPVDTVTMDAVPPVLKRQNAIGVADGTALLRARAKGAPIKAFATMFQASPLGIAVLEKSPIHSLADLKGKKIGLHSYDRPQLATMLATVELKPADVSILEITDDIDSLIDGKIDAQVCYLIDESVALEERGQKVRTFPGFKHGYYAYSQVYFCTEKLLEQNPGLLETFLRATNLGWEEAVRDPEGTARMIVKKYSPKSSVGYQKRSIELIQPLLTVESGPGSDGQMKRSTWLKSAKSNGLTENGLVDYTVLPRLYPHFKP